MCPAKLADSAALLGSQGDSSPFLPCREALSCETHTKTGHKSGASELTDASDKLAQDTAVTEEKLRQRQITVPDLTRHPALTLVIQSSDRAFCHQPSGLGKEKPRFLSVPLGSSLLLLAPLGSCSLMPRGNHRNTGLWYMIQKHSVLSPSLTKSQGPANEVLATSQNCPDIVTHKNFMFFPLYRQDN